MIMNDIFDADDLLAIRDRIADKDHWTQREDRVTDLDGSVRFCVLGHISDYLGLYDGRPTKNVMKYSNIVYFLDEVSNRKFHASSVQVNDQFGHESVLDLLDEAIRVKKDEK